MPYAPYGGLIEVQDAESGGSTESSELVHLHINACSENATGIINYPVRYTPLTLDAPMPNPANALVRFRYSVDAPGPGSGAYFLKLSAGNKSVARKIVVAHYAFCTGVCSCGEKLI